MMKKLLKCLLVFTVCACLLCACSGKISDITQSPTPTVFLGEASVQTQMPDAPLATPTAEPVKSATPEAPDESSTPKPTQSVTATEKPTNKPTNVPTATPKPTIASTATPVPCAHSATKISNRKLATNQADGYSGDMYCLSCSALVHAGSAISKSIASDVTLFSMMTASQMVVHQYYDIECEVLRLCNAARAAEGLAPLSFYEDAYCFTKIRADECHQLFSHSRPDGRSWSTVYTDASVTLYGTWGENLYKSTGYSLNGIAQNIFNGWMNSQGHRENIMRDSFTRVAIAITVNGSTLTAVQNFFS